MLPYLPIFLFAILEGEIYYSKVCADAVSRRAAIGCPCSLAGALGGATGDQFWFYLLRGRIHWLDRYPRLGTLPRTASAPACTRTKPAIVLVSRFLPGLRTAIPDRVRVRRRAADQVQRAESDQRVRLGRRDHAVREGRFDDAARAFGLNRWWGPFIPAALIIIFFRWLAGPSREK